MTGENIAELLSEHRILRFNGFKCEFESLNDFVAVEDEVTLYVNNRLYTVFHCSPSKMRELAVGHLLTLGAISGLEEILKIDVSGGEVHVQLSVEKTFSALGGIRVMFASCGGEGNKLSQRKDSWKVRFNRTRFRVEVIFRAVEFLNSMAEVFRASGGTHAAAILDEKGELISFAEDIGRHNAVDKAVGEALIMGVDFSRVLLASTGRLTSEIVVKALRAGIPVLVSVSSPTSMGIKLSERFGLTLIGFARGKRFNIYASPDRIEYVST